MKDTANPTKTESRGVLPGVAHLALDVVDRGQSTAIGVLQDARTELRASVDSGIELVEKVATSAFRFARKATARLDEGVAETLTSVQRLLSSAVASARETTRSAAELAASAGRGVAQA
jgi:hypothetical protein